MPKQRHKLKTETAYYQAVDRGEKLFEVRKNDRDFKVGDLLYLQETVNGVYTGRELTMVVTYILPGGQFGIEEGYCVMQIKSFYS